VSGFWDDEDNRNLAEFIFVTCDYGTLCDGVRGVENPLEIGGVYVRGPDDDDLFDPVVHVEEAFFILMRSVAGAEPAVDERVVVCVRVVRVLLDNERPAKDHLPGFTGTDIVHLVVYQTNLAVRNG